MMSPDALSDDCPAPVTATDPHTPIDTTAIAATAAAAAAAAADSGHGNSHRVANAVVHVEPLGSSGLGERSPGEKVKCVSPCVFACVRVLDCVRLSASIISFTYCASYHNHFL